MDPISRMAPYGAAHIAALLTTVLLAIVLVYVARRLRGTATEGRSLTVAGAVMLAATVLWMIWNMLPMNWNVEQSLPFHLSDALRIVTSFALLTRNGPLIAITYFWGLTLNLQSVITPDLNYFHAPVLEYLAYWFFHIAVLIVPIVFVWGLGYRPTWRGYGIAFGATVAWAAIAAVANTLTGANYGYLARAPEGPSVLDVLGPWPMYLLWEAVLIAGVWALITWPWTTARLRGISLGASRAVSRVELSTRPPVA